MGTIKDLVDLTTQLANSVQDRQVAAELNNIQQLILQLQSEQAELHEKNMTLREEQLQLKERISVLEAERSAPVDGLGDVPICPNCSTKARPHYLSELPSTFRRQLGATHRCPQCDYTISVSN